MTAATASQDGVRELLLLRTFVAVLGERATPAWWRTQFLTEVGLRSMTRVFPRTAASAALSSVSIAAREEHDRRIGLGERYHLFRLPANLERGIALLMSEEAFVIQTARLVSKGTAELISELTAMTHGRKETAEGPVKVGSTISLAKPLTVEILAAHYQHSFETSRRAFPYFGDLKEQQ